MKLYFFSEVDDTLNVQNASHVSILFEMKGKTRVGCLIASIPYFLHSENNRVSTCHVQEAEHRVSAPV